MGLGSKVLILGAGPIGLSALISAKSMGADDIVITDIVGDRLELAKELGAKHTVIVSKDATEEELVAKIHAALGSAPDISIDCGGFESTNRLALLATRSGGNFFLKFYKNFIFIFNFKIFFYINFIFIILIFLGVVVIVGCGPPEVKLPLISCLTREIDIRGVFRYCNDYPTALALVSSGKIDVKKLITHHFDITQTKEAFDTARYNRDGAIKVMIHCTPRDENNPIPF